MTERFRRFVGIPDEKVQVIRFLARETLLSFREIARLFGVSLGAVNHVIQGRSWQHVKPLVVGGAR